MLEKRLTGAPCGATFVSVIGSPHGFARSAARNANPPAPVRRRSFQFIVRTALSGSAQPTRQNCFGARLTIAGVWSCRASLRRVLVNTGGGEEAILSGRMSRQSGLEKTIQIEPPFRHGRGPNGGTYPVRPPVWWGGGGDLSLCPIVVLLKSLTDTTIIGHCKMTYQFPTIDVLNEHHCSE